MIREAWRRDVLSDDERAAIDVLEESLQYDLVRTYKFWEQVVARVVGGRTTDHRCQWDIEIDYPGGDIIRVEVKFSQEQSAAFTDGRRNVMKFANPLGGQNTSKPTDVVVFIGIDELDGVWAWTVPEVYLRKVPSITLTSPRFRLARSSDRGLGLDSWAIPFDQVLTGVLRAWHFQRGDNPDAQFQLDGIDL